MFGKETPVVVDYNVNYVDAHNGCGLLNVSILLL